MNTEPPEGDDLQRMLVSMKQNVLERATPRPKRRRFRPGIALGIVGLLAIGTATGAVALSLSQQETPVAAPTTSQAPESTPSVTTPTSAPITQRPTPRPTPTPTPSALPVADVRIPGTCAFLVPIEDDMKFFGLVNPTEFIVDEDGAHPSTAQERIDGLVDPKAGLSCAWQNEGVVANISVSVARTTAEYAADAETSARSLGGSCDERLGGRMCQADFVAQGQTLPTTETTFLRGDILITIQQTDFPTDGLLPAIVGEIWGD
jgi:hypothetical protein